MINYMSDIHLEFGPLECDIKGKFLILAGDITIKARVEWINKKAENFEHVIYVFGNHEFYRSNLDSIERKTRENLSPNVHLLQNESIELDGVRFHGATLWTNYNNNDPMAKINANFGLTDHKLIRCDGGVSRFTPDRAYEEHLKTMEYFKNNVKEGDIVVTHHAPSHKSIHPSFKTSNLNHSYYSDLSDFILKYKPKLWFHGHTHNNFNYLIGGTKVLCNPRGYAGHKLNPNFDVNASVTL